MSNSSVHRTKGFTLVEVLVALVIISVGLLGIAATQAVALGTTAGAHIESLVAIEAQSLAAAMEADSDYWAAGHFPSKAFTVTGATISSNGLKASADCTAKACTPTEMAAYDLRRWGQNLQNLIPTASGKISCKAGVPPVCTITVAWTEKTAAAINKGTANQSATRTLNYTLVNQL